MVMLFLFLHYALYHYYDCTVQYRLSFQWWMVILNLLHCSVNFNSACHDQRCVLIRGPSVCGVHGRNIATICEKLDEIQTFLSLLILLEWMCSNWLLFVVVEIRQQDSKSYLANTLFNIVAGIQRHLRSFDEYCDVSFFLSVPCFLGYANHSVVVWKSLHRKVLAWWSIEQTQFLPVMKLLFGIMARRIWWRRKVWACSIFI